VPDFDPAAAGKLLDAAGWIDSDKDGIRDKGGKQLRLVMIGGEKPAVKDASGPPVKAERDYFIEAARRIGVVIEVKSGGESWVEKRREEGNYDLVEIAWGGMVDSDVTPLLGGRDPRIDPAGQAEPGQLHLWRALEQMAAAWDPAERTKASGDLAAALAEVWPIAGIVAEAPQGLVHRRVQNVKVWDGWLDLGQLKLESAP
jgi:ABC-type transport system substrate-binding protein